MKYILLFKDSIWELENEVNKFLEKGWELQGGASYTDSFYLQAIVFKFDTDISWDKQTKENRLSRGKYIEEILAGISFMVCVGLIILIAIILIK